MAQAKTAVQRANIGRLPGDPDYINPGPVKISVYDYVPLTGCCNPGAVDENGIPFNQCDWDHTNTYQCQKGDRTDGTSSKCPVKDRYGNIKYYNKQCCIPVDKGWCSGNEECCGNTDVCINGVCVQGMKLSLTPNPVWTGKTVTATITNCNNCEGKRAYVAMGQYRITKCTCTIVNSQCSCSFTAPGTSASSTDYIYYARVDRNGDGKYADYGEEASATLKVYCKSLSQQCGLTQPCCLGYTCSYGVCQQPQSGCPVLKVWDGNGYKDVVKLNIHSERGKDTTTSIGFTMEPKDGKYYVKLSEIWYAMLEGSHIDSVKLTDDTGNECKLVSAIHDKKGDVLTAIAKSEDVRVETKPGEEIDLVFDRCKGEELVFSIEGYNRWYLEKMALSQIGITIVLVGVLVIALLAVMFGIMKNMKKKRR
jgi:hypothetical protein